MLSQMKWFALFIWIRPVLDRMRRDQEEKLVSHLEEEMNIEFGSSQRAETEFCTSSVQTIFSRTEYNFEQTSLLVQTTL